jgi:lipopolysaccharide export system protein LptA
MLRRYLALITLATAQTVIIENAEELSGTDEVRHLKGAVALRQDTIQLFCDEADLYQNNAFYARGAVRTLIGQSGTISSARLSYDPITRHLTYEGQVVATFGTTTLRTERLTYDRQTETASYTGGGSLTDTSGTIYSLYATYHLPTETVTFTQQVRVEHPPYQAFTDSLLYHTSTLIATFPTPFTLYNTLKPETLFAHSGQWQRQESLLTLYGQVVWRTPEIFLRADYAFYDQKADTGLAACNVFYQSRTGKGWGMADSAFWHPDTLSLKENIAAFLFTERDTAFLQSQLAFLIPPRLYLIGEAAFLRPPLSAMADTILYDTLTQNLFLFGRAWLYSHPYQLFARHVRLTLPQNTPDSLLAAGSVFTASQVDTLLRFYHQVHSDSLIAKWDSTLEAFTPIRYLHNLRAIYYQAEGSHYQGAHEILRAHSLFLTLGPNRQPSYLRLENHPQGRFIPIKLLLTHPPFLPAFQWRPPKDQPHWPIHP